MVSDYKLRQFKADYHDMQEFMSTEPLQREARREWAKVTGRKMIRAIDRMDKQRNGKRRLVPIDPNFDVWAWKLERQRLKEAKDA